MPTAISLFSGIGGLDYPASVAGFDILAQVEIDPFCQQVLEKHHETYWNRATLFADVHTVGRHNLPKVDCIFGGFPCQGISHANKHRRGLQDPRSGLWYEFARIVSEIRPRAVLVENVANITTEGGISVVTNLAELGYRCQWGIISAEDFGFPFQRKRWFLVGFLDNLQCETGRTYQSGKGDIHQTGATAPCDRSSIGDKSYPSFATGSDRGNDSRTRFESELGRNTHGISAGLVRHSHVARPNEAQYPHEAPRVISKTNETIAERNLRRAKIAALGNAVVPQVVYPLFVAIRLMLEAQYGTT